MKDVYHDVYHDMLLDGEIDMYLIHFLDWEPEKEDIESFLKRIFKGASVKVVAEEWTANYAAYIVEIEYENKKKKLTAFTTWAHGVGCILRILGDGGREFNILLSPLLSPNP